MIDIDKLEPCPYCGDYGAEVAESNVTSIFGGLKKAVFCNLCFAEGPTAETVTNAVAAWNRRATQAVPALTDDWRDQLAALVDIYDDAMNNPPESRTYVDGAFKQQMDEARALLAAPQPPQEPRRYQD